MQTITIEVSENDMTEAQAICEALGQKLNDWLTEMFQDALSRQRIRKRNMDEVLAVQDLMPVEGGGSVLRPRPVVEIKVVR